MSRAPSSGRRAQGQGGHSSGREQSPGEDRPQTLTHGRGDGTWGRRVSGEGQADWSGFAGEAGVGPAERAELRDRGGG